MMTPRLVPTLLFLGVAGAAAAAALEVRLDTGGSDWVRRDQAIRLVLDRLPQPAEGRLAVLVGEVDMTDLFRVEQGALVYRPELAPLPGGESQVLLYLVSPGDDWQEVGSFPLNVLRRAGFQKLELTPRLDLESLALLDDHSGGADTGFRDGTGQIDLRGGFQRPGLGFTGQLNVVGATAQEQALRFGQEADGAPKADLSSYQLALTRGRGAFQLGHLSWGTSRHLIRGFSSRGVAAAAPLGRWGSLSLGAMNGSSIVGWDNLLGLDDSAHQVAAATLGIELVPDRPGALRLEGTFLDGSLLPLSGFNQGQVNDREESSGWSLALGTSTLSQRLRLSGGYAESRFDNPLDPTLAQGADLVAVEEETRDARYLDLELDLVRNRSLRDDLPLTLTLGWQHERVEPLYKTVAAYVPPDVDQDLLSLTATLGPISARLSHSDAEDNLDDLRSVLKTLTDRDALDVAVPLAALLRVDGRGGTLLPLVAYSYGRTHQRGAGIPENSGFSASHVPDQMSRSHVASLQWQGNRWGLGYNLSRSHQDNRQPGREEADFSTRAQGLTLGLVAHQRVDVNLDWSRERSTNEEVAEVARTTRYSLGFNWRPTDRMSVFGTGSRTDGEVDPAGSQAHNDLVDLQWSYRFPWELRPGHGVTPQLFVRYSWQDNEIRDPLFEIFDAATSWSVTSGINVSFF
ncbi:MAG TPA: hypothetical protein VMT16_11630 [Thermoanaerobaculia bacterium]|nr:hypothetical protein [Thermoanaerobaculia bacterium]